ncbi:MAG: glycosyltransferase family 4 protein [Anaerolineae bacterium]|nr:glycosyltransferase family 4 protein [Anaerolineae bacterium]
MKKILLVANTDWYLYNFRLSLAKALQQHGHQVILVSPPGRFVAALQEAGLAWLPWEVGRKSIAPWAELPAVFSLAQIYRRQRPDIVHHHTLKPIIYGTLAARLLKLPAVINSVAGLGYVFSAGQTKARLLRPLTRRFFNLAAAHPRCEWIFENAADRHELLNQSLLVPARTHLIQSVGVDVERFAPSPEPPDPPVVLFAGRMLADKGVGVLVEAVRLLGASISVRLQLIGESDPGNPSSISPAALRAWQADGLVEWHGFRPDMQSAYAAAHIVALPTAYGEGVPTVLLEAAACARPIVASDTPGCRAIVQPGVNGLLVPPNDPAALAAALRTLLADPALRQHMGAAGRQLVLDKFTNTHVNAQTLAVYHNL